MCEKCNICGEDLTENELEYPMDEQGTCDDCVDDRIEASMGFENETA